MADNQPNGQSTASFESSPPRGLNVEDGLSHAGQTSDLDATDASDSLDNTPTEGAMITDLNNDIDQDVSMQEIEQSLDYRQFSPGFSDDEDNGQAFEHDWSSRQAKRQAVKAAKSKKSPRRSDDDADLEPRVRTKKAAPFFVRESSRRNLRGRAGGRLLCTSDSRTYHWQSYVQSESRRRRSRR